MPQRLVKKVFFHLNPIKNLRSLIKEFHFNDQYQWLSLTVNQKSYDQTNLTKEIQLTPINVSKSPLRTLVLSESQTHFKAIYFENNLHLFAKKWPIHGAFPEIKGEMAQNFDRIIESELEHFKIHLNQEPFSQQNIAMESKALEWMRVSFIVLNKAIVESLANPDLLFQATLFVGLNPQTNLHEIRVIAFNLDMSFRVLPSNDLRVIISNHTPHSSSVVLQGDYSYHKREMVNLLIDILGPLGQGIKK